MSDNCKLLRAFIEQKTIEINYGPIFNEPVAPMPQDFDFERIEGMMLGLAVGDALGNTTESQLPQKRHRNHGEIRDYLPNRHANGQCVGLPTDDTQLAFWTLEQLIEDKRFVPENVAKRFSKNRIFGIGGTVRKFLSHIKAGKPWHESGPPRAGNGALMRIAPMLIPHLSKGGKGLWCDAALSAMITHNDTGSIAACVAFIGMLWDLLTAEQPPEPEWWLNRYISIAKGIETGKIYRPRGGKLHTDYEGPMWGYVERTIQYAMEKNLSVQDAKEIWYSAAYLLETMTFALLILMRHAHEPEEAIVRAVNDTKDNDTTAAIVGAAIGALHGRDNLPERWLKGLLGRTGKDDDGKVFELLTHARHSFWNAKEKDFG